MHEIPIQKNGILASIREAEFHKAPGHDLLSGQKILSPERGKQMRLTRIQRKNATPIIWGGGVGLSVG